MEFATELVARHANSITSLRLPSTYRVSFPAEVVSQLDTIPLQPSDDVNNAHRLLAQVVPRLLNLRRVELAFDTTGAEWIFAQMSESVSDRIVHLVLRAVGWTPIHALAHFLAALSSLQHLELDFGAYELSGSRELLAVTLVSWEASNR